MLFAVPFVLLSSLALALFSGPPGPQSGNGGKPTSGEPVAPPVDLVARRMLLLAKQLEFVAMAFPLAGFASRVSKIEPEGQRAQFIEDLHRPFHRAVEQLKKDSVWDAATAEERAFFEAAPFGLTMQQLVDGSWKGEAAIALGWALGLVPEMPPFDRMVDRKDVFQLASRVATLELTATLALRAREELEEARRLAQLWHWRSRMRELEQAGFRPIQELGELGVHTFQDLVRSTVAEAQAAGVRIEVLDGDLAARGKPYRDTTEQEWQELARIAEERHRALTWACGMAPGNRWEETPLHT